MSVLLYDHGKPVSAYCMTGHCDFCEVDGCEHGCHVETREETP